jgi:hypothetical protein
LLFKALHDIRTRAQSRYGRAIQAPDSGAAPDPGAKHNAEDDMAKGQQRSNREKKKPKQDKNKDKPKSGNPNTPFSSGSNQDGQKGKK